MGNLGLSRPHRLLSAGASPPVCLSFAGWLSHCLLSRASTSGHLSSRSRLTHPSSIPSLHSCQLVVTSHLFAPPPPLNATPPHDWLCCCNCQCVDVVAVNAHVSLLSLRLQLSPSSLIIKLELLPSSSLMLMSVAIIVIDVSHRAVAIVIVVVAHHAVAIIVDFVARCESLKN